MKLVQYLVAGHRSLGVVIDDMVADLAGVHRVAVLNRQGFAGETADQLAKLHCPSDIGFFLALGQEARDRADAVARMITGCTQEMRQSLRSDGLLVPLSAVVFEPPIGVGNTIYCVGLNYADHAAEAGADVPVAPGIFIRTAATVVGHQRPILRPSAVSTDLDFEGELAVVIGRPCHRVNAGTAEDFVAGYTVFNDGSVRDYQKRVSAFLTPGKNFFQSGSLGPWIVTAEELGNPARLDLTTRINGRTVQSASTAEMIFDVRALVSFVSEFAVLQPGDIIATGTPSGVGFRDNPPWYLVPGDIITIELGGIGILENSVREEKQALEAMI
jgi:2-keto-4-pentenoate hydratase/2-oxohepta-3-ene-1,7-dioic acid hydratase in catechol pathway